MKRPLILLALPLTLLWFVFLFQGKISALSGSDFQASRIIDDSIFFNGTSMSPAEIQQFLNSKVPVCDTNGTQPYGGTTRAEYAASRGYPAPFICLKDYRQDTPSKPAEPGLCGTYSGANRSAAEIIYEVGVSCGISQRTLLVLLEKEQSLVTDDWPWSIQYRSATGYGCPDTAPCDAEYYGFFNQVYSAARQYKKYGRDASSFRYRSGRLNYIQYNPNAGCGGTDVNIENQATAGLYNFTPYQPNPSALSNLYGSGDGCGAYGNRNFWRLHNEWFGPTTQTDNYWVLVKHPVDGRYFIATNFAIHYVPSGQVMSDWGISQVQPITASLSFLNSRTIGSPLNRLLNDKYGNTFLMDGGKRHYIRDRKYLSLYNLDPNSSVGITGLVSYVSESEWLGYCPRFASNSAYTYVMDNGVRKWLPNIITQSAWGCGQQQNIALSDNFLSTYTDGGTISRYGTTTSGLKFVADQGRLWNSGSNSQTTDFYTPPGQPSTSIGWTLEQLIPKSNLTLFAMDASNGAWYLVENGKKHYIISGKIATLWGYGGSQGSINTISNALLATLSNGSNLSVAVQTSSPNRYYLLGGNKKHYLPDARSISEWLPASTPIETMPDNVLDQYPDGDILNSAVAKNQNGDYFLVQSGLKIALTHMNLVDAWSSPTISILNTSNTLYDFLSLRGGMPYVVRDGNNYFYMEAGTKYPINSAFAYSWSLGTSISITADTLSRYPTSPVQMKPYVAFGGKTYTLINQTRKEVDSSVVAVIPQNEISPLQRNYFPEQTFPKSSYLLRSTTQTDPRLWIVSRNGKVLLPNVASALNFGYISRSIELTYLPAESLDLIPTDSTASSLLLQSPSGAIKLVSFGEGLGFNDNSSVIAWASITNSVIPVSDAVFNLFPVQRTATKIIRDDLGKVYVIENGKKRWILNSVLLNTTFSNIPQTYVHSTASSQIPDGAVLQ